MWNIFDINVAYAPTLFRIRIVTQRSHQGIQMNAVFHGRWFGCYSKFVGCQGAIYMYLTHWGWVTHICFRKAGYHWFMWWLLACSAPSHCWNIVSWTLRNKLRWNVDRNSDKVIQQNAFEDVVYEMGAILLEQTKWNRWGGYHFCVSNCTISIEEDFRKSYRNSFIENLERCYAWFMHFFGRLF